MPVDVDSRCRYTKNHEWVRVDGEHGYAGITDYAQQQLSDIVYVELPEVGDTFSQGEVFGVVESVKAASDCYMPIAGEIVELNEKLLDSPDLVNRDPYGEGWFIKFLVEDEDELDSLMAPGAYKALAEKALEEGGS